MRQKQLLFLTIQQFIFVVFLIITTTIFFIALNRGNDGVSIRLFGGGDDGYFYWEQAKNVASGKEWVRTSIYPLIIGYLIKITRFESVYLIRLFNFAGFILLVIFSIQLIKLQYLDGDRKVDLKCLSESGILLLFAFLLYPSLQMNVNLSIYRDVWIYTLYTLSTVLSVELFFYKKGLFRFVLLLFSLWLLGEFRRYALFSFLLSLMVYFIYEKVRNTKITKLLLLAIVILLYGLYYTLFIDYVLPIVNMSLRSALNYRKYFLFTNPGGSQMWINLDQPNYLLFIINYAHSYFGNLLGPLPWHISGIATLFVFFAETIPMGLILAFLWRKRNLLSKVQRYILLHTFVWTGLIAVSNDNIGTATRLRVVGWILILTVFVVVFVQNKQKNTRFKGT